MRPEIAPGPHSRPPWRASDLAVASFRAGSLFDTVRRFLAGRSEPPFLRPKPLAGLSCASLRSRKTGNHRSPRRSRASDRFPRVRRVNAAGFPRERSGQSLFAPGSPRFGFGPRPSSVVCVRQRRRLPSGFSLPRVTPFSSAPKSIPSRCRSVRSKPHRLQNSSLHFNGLRHDPQSVSCSRHVKSAPRIRVAQALFVHLIHRLRRNGG